MTWRRTSGLALLGLCVATAAAAADSAALADAAEHRDWAGVRTLIQQNASGVNDAQVDGTTALHWAVYHDDAEAARVLVRARANANAVNRYGVPPLALAATNGNAAIVALLLEAGADANATLKGDETVLMLAARAGNPEAVKALLTDYTKTSGMFDQAQDRLNKQISGLDTQMADMQRRLDLQRAALVKEYTAADLAMSQLKNQSGALGSFGTSTKS